MVNLRNVEATEIDIEGIVLPLLNLNHAEQVEVNLRFRGRDYAFTSSVPSIGYGAILPGRVRQALEEGRRALLVDRGERYYLYLTPERASPPG